jgi:nicotinamide-nucleotide amidase
MAEIIPRIALLSTGDELVNGDTLNTNSHVIAQQLYDHDIQPGLHITASDDQSDIERAITWLLADHVGLIMTGGLGPTSDDRTRYALGEVLHSGLVFDEPCWERVVERLQRFALPIPETNRQQCLFPPGAIIFPNHNGTAAGCQVMHGKKAIFMLPGPPFECLPIFQKHVLPFLQANDYGRPLFRCEWLLLGVSEGGIAEILDPMIKDSGCYVGYRINLPYLEVKLQSADAAILEKMRLRFNEMIGSQSVSQTKQKASAQLKQYILEKRLKLRINDHATGGLLATTLLDPSTYSYLDFTRKTTELHKTEIVLKGLDSYWNQQAKSKTIVELEIINSQNHHPITLTVPFRKERTPLYAVEMTCWEILKNIR